MSLSGFPTLVTQRVVVFLFKEDPGHLGFCAKTEAHGSDKFYPVTHLELSTTVVFTAHVRQVWRCQPPYY